MHQLGVASGLAPGCERQFSHHVRAAIACGSDALAAAYRHSAALPEHKALAQHFPFPNTYLAISR